MKFLVAFFLMLVYTFSFGQFTIEGQFSELKNTQIQLLGFEGFENYIIDQVTTDADGNFKLNFTADEKGMGILSARENQSLVIVLTNETIVLKGIDLASTQNISYLEGNENKLFATYSTNYSIEKNALSAWNYLQQLYRNTETFKAENSTARFIENEIDRIQKADQEFLKNLPADSYISWFIPIRKLVSEVSEIAQRKPELIQPSIAFFRALDYTDPKFYKSGLYKDAIEAHYWLIENSGLALPQVIEKMNTSSDMLISNLKEDADKLNDVAAFLFQFLEKRSLFQASEHLAKSLLNDEACLLDEGVASQLEIYRKMKTGNTAEDIVFSKDVLQQGKSVNYQKMSDIRAEYYVVAFGSSWCPACVQEIPKLQESYKQWQEKGIEVIFISLDTEERKYKNFTKNFPFVSHCDYKKWETKAVKDYFVNATPTLYLLDKNRNIRLKPKNIEQLNAWINQKIPPKSN